MIPSPDSRSESSDNTVLLKLKDVRYYKNKHSLTAVPIKGLLYLDKKTLSFQPSKGHMKNLHFDLDSISVHQFRGRSSSGVKVIRHLIGRGDESECFIFTKVNHRSYEIIIRSIDEAKWQRESQRQRRSSAQALENSGVCLSTSLSADDDGREDRPVLSTLMKPFHIIIFVLYTLINFVYKSITGRRFWAPKNMHRALKAVQRKVNPILKVSKKTLSERSVDAIEKEIDSIHEALLSIQSIHQRQGSTYLPHGSVADSTFDSASIIDQSRLIFWRFMGMFSFVYFTIKLSLNLPQDLFRFDLIQPYQHPSTVSQAVKNANHKLEALMELAAREELSSTIAKQQIMEEAKHIQVLLYNIKMHSTDGSLAQDGSLPLKEE